MRITRISATNFRSFRKLDLELGEFNVLVGANASGKSNLLEIVRFWRDAARYGVENAVSIQGGREFLLHRSSEKPDTLSMRICFDTELILVTSPDSATYTISSIDYSFTLKFHTGGHKVLADDLVLHTRRQVDADEGPGGDGSIRYHRSDWRRGTYRMELRGDLPPMKKLSPFGITSTKQTFKLGRHMLIDTTPALIFAQLSGGTGGMCSWDRSLAKVGFYDFDPKVAKKSSAMTGLQDLESDGSNLATVLYRILGKPETRKRFTALLRETLPQIDEINVQRHLDRTLVYRIAETDSRNDFFPAPLLSDGTVNITAIIAALFFENISMAVLEEPERNLHPGLVRAVVELLQDASGKRQIIVSTHSPELVKYAGVESLVFVRRDASGGSEIVRPSDSDTVKAFLEKDVGLDKVFVMDMFDADAADA